MLTASPTDASNPFVALNGTSFGIDFNPVPDLAGNPSLRVISNNDQNLRINANNGQTFTDTDIGSDAAEPGLNPNITGAGYANNDVNRLPEPLYTRSTDEPRRAKRRREARGSREAASAGVGAMMRRAGAHHGGRRASGAKGINVARPKAIRTGRCELSTEGRDTSSALNAFLESTNANNGTYVTEGLFGFDISDLVGFDISGTGVGFAADLLTGPASLYTIDLSSGAATTLGTIGSGAFSVLDIAALPSAVPEPGSIALLSAGMVPLLLGMRMHKRAVN